MSTNKGFKLYVKIYVKTSFNLHIASQEYENMLENTSMWIIQSA